MRAAFTSTVAPGPVVWAAVHAGHDLRPEIKQFVALDDATRRREEDPFTDLLLGNGGSRFVAHRSRFEVDLNRPREGAVYRVPEDAWGLRVFRRPLPDAVVEASRAIHDEFYAALADQLDPLAVAGPFLVLDIHSYNHRRAGQDAPQDPVAENPEINVGSGWLDTSRWGRVVEVFIDALRDQSVAGHRLDVRENVKFLGRYLSEWVSRRYPDTGCTLSLECKKIFMDEWTGTPDYEHIAQLCVAITAATQRAVASLPRGAG